jgi:hypothetical protein
LTAILRQAHENLPQVDHWLELAIRENPAAMTISKWGEYLPIQLQIALLKCNEYDFETLENFLARLNLVHYHTSAIT